MDVMSLRVLNERGAALVEFGFLLAFFIVIITPAFVYLIDKFDGDQAVSQEEVINQALESALYGNTELFKLDPSAFARPIRVCDAEPLLESKADIAAEITGLDNFCARALINYYDDFIGDWVSKVHSSSDEDGNSCVIDQFDIPADMLIQFEASIDQDEGKNMGVGLEKPETGQVALGPVANVGTNITTLKDGDIPCP